MTTIHKNGAILLASEHEMDERELRAVLGALPGATAMPGCFRPDRFYIAGGAAVEIPPCPGEFHEWRAETRAWVFNSAALTASVVARRNALLLASDWTQLPDVPLETKAAWTTYRQALRDITDQPGFPLDINWPESP